VPEEEAPEMGDAKYESTGLPGHPLLLSLLLMERLVSVFANAPFVGIRLAVHFRSDTEYA
jgi:hypothetical protein